MTGGFWRKNGVKKGARIQLTTRFRPVWLALRRTPKVASAINRWIINQLVYMMRTRPGALSTMSPWTSWESLHDRTYSQRHLPPRPEFQTGLPQPSAVAALFELHSGAADESRKSSRCSPCSRSGSSTGSCAPIRPTT